MSFKHLDISRGVNWVPALFIVIYQSILLLGLPFYLYYHPPGIGVVLAMAVLLYLSGLAITAGYHRYFAHKSFKTYRPIEMILLFFGSMAVQGSALRWSFDHRIHHAHVDTPDDPYSIKKGFWYAHFLWLFEKPKEIEPKVVGDLLQNPLVMFQHKFQIPLMIATNALAFFVVGWFFEDYLGAFVIALWLRMFCLHHFTWFINSLAHTWGDKPFSQEQSAVNNYVISLLTFGEGYHNYHHTFANDYRNGIRWYHFDPTKWLIYGLSLLGLTYNLRRIDKASIQKRMVNERKFLLLERLKNLWYVQREDLEKAILETSEKVLSKLGEVQNLKNLYKKAKKENESKEYLISLKRELKSLKKGLQADWKNWKKLAKTIMRMQALPV